MPQDAKKLPLVAKGEVAANGADTASVVNHLYKEVRPYQWVREVLENSRDAGAKRFELDIERQAMMKHGVKRALVIDDGCGMSPQGLLSFARLGCSDKTGHFGVGAKVSILPWNPDGMVVGSYQNGQGSLIWIRWDDKGRKYELRTFDTDRGPSVVVDPEELKEDGVRWGKVMPPWGRAHGTFIVLLGSKKYPNTVVGDESRAEGKSRNLVKAVNTRYWDLSDMNAKAWNPVDKGPRQLIGAKHYVENVKPHSKKGELASSGVVLLDKDRVRAEWFLWHGERPNQSTYGDAKGFVGVRFDNELYERYEASAHLGLFGIVGALQRNVTIVLTPQPKDRGWGVESTTSRQGLTMWEGYKQTSLPNKVADWGEEFVTLMPEDIKKAHHELMQREVTQQAVDDELLSILGPGTGFDKAMRAVRAETRSHLAVANAAGDKRGVITDEVFNTLPFPNQQHIGGDTRESASKDPQVTLDADHTSQVVDLGRRGEKASIVEAEVFRLPKTTWSEENDGELPWAPIRWQPRDVDGQQLITIYGKSPFIAPLLITLNEERKKRGPIVQGEALIKAQEAIKKLGAAAIVHVQRVAHDMKMNEEQTARMLSPESLASVFAGFIAQRQFIRSKLRTLGGGDRED